MKMTYTIARMIAFLVFVASMTSTALIADTASADMAEAAKSFLASLNKEQKAKAAYPFNEDRKDWHFIPKDREAVFLGEMSEDQKELVYKLLRAGLSVQGVETVDSVRGLESVLQLIEGPNRQFPRDPDHYHVWIFGKPGDEAWGWRFEGHHISLSATVVGDEVSMSPMFFGANPAEVKEGPRKGFRALPREEDSVFKLMRSLNEEQTRKAVFNNKAPNDILSFVDRKAQPLPIEGLPASEMSAEQLELLKDVVDAFILKYKAEVYEDAIALVEKGGWGNATFGWAGPVERFQGNYYFVQGPDFLLEYDNTQNQNNHIHAVWREFDGDFGEDILQKHHRDHSH